MWFLIEATNYCNYRCPYCPNPTTARTRGWMSTDTFQNIVAQLVAHGPTTRNYRVSLHGFGEPLMSPYFFDHLAILGNHGFHQVDITTNGMLLDEEKAARLVEFGFLNWVRISLNSTRPELMEYINKGARFNVVMENTARFLELVAAAGYPFKVWIQLMETRQNPGESIEDVYRLFGRRDFAATRKRLDTMAGQLEAGEHAFDSDYPAGCLYGNQTVFVHWDGDMVGCCYDDTKRQVFGNIRDGIFAPNTQANRALMSAALQMRDWKTVPVCRNCTALPAHRARDLVSITA